MSVGVRPDFASPRIRVGDSRAPLIGMYAVEIVLIDIQFHLEIVKVGQRHHERLRAAIADEGGGDHFALLDIPLENRAGGRHSDLGGIQDGFRVVRCGSGAGGF